MHFEQVSLEKVKEQIASRKVSLMSSNDGVPESCGERLGERRFQPGEGSTMKGQKEQWMRLCELAAVEQDQEKLLTLVKEINRLLDEKEEPPRG